MRKMYSRQDKRAHRSILSPALLDDVDVVAAHSLPSSVALAVLSRSAKLLSKAVRTSGPSSKIVTSEQDLNAWKPPYSVDFLSGKKTGMVSAYYEVRYENDIWGMAVAKDGPCKLPQGTLLKVHDQG